VDSPPSPQNASAWPGCRACCASSTWNPASWPRRSMDGYPLVDQQFANWKIIAFNR
jgi:hypothetical protein